tara:strand:+ start:477 stop:899 length:423 start_codon:yes stop_codon:yes gene_type:complete
MSNIDIKNKVFLSTMRKLAISAWGHPKDPSIYAQLELEVSPMIHFLNRYNKQSPIKVTSLHFVAKVLGCCLEKTPALNQVLIRNQLYQRSNINLFFPVHLKSKKSVNLSGVCVQDIPEKSLADIANDLHDQSLLLRRGAR